MTQHEAHLDAIGERRTRGSFYTPEAAVTGLLRISLDRLLAERSNHGITAVAAVRVCDPACGTGNFLTAAATRIRSALVVLGMNMEDASHAALRCVAGVDMDANAAELCRDELAAVLQVERSDETDSNILSADSLLMPLENDSDSPSWKAFQQRVGAPNGFDLVIGNPPFISQTRSETAFAPRYAKLVKKRFEGVATAATDPAALFMVVASQIIDPDNGRVCLIEPVSTLSSAGAARVREVMGDAMALTHIWFTDEQLFAGASVEVWASVWRAGTAQQAVTVLTGSRMRPHSTAQYPGSQWGMLLAISKGVPDELWQTDGIVSSICSATADFRDQYYGLVGHVHDSETQSHGPKLVTSGLIDPAHLLWGKKRTKFNREAFTHPRVDVAALTPALQTWAAKRAVPKILLATQTRVLEPIVDIDGSLLPSVPVLTICADDDSDLWMLGALLVSPPISAIAAARHYGAALSSTALKLSAKDVLALPLPKNRKHWEEAAEAFHDASLATSSAERREHLIASGDLMCRAFGVPPYPLLGWWSNRLPK